MARLASIASLFVVVACGGPSHSTSSTTAPTRVPLPLPPASPANAGCGSTLDLPPGGADRFVFEAGDGQVGYKDGAGAVVIAPRFSFAYEFNPHGLAAAVEAPTADTSARFVYIDPTGAVLAQAYAYDNGPDYFVEGLARIVADGKVGFIDAGGAIVIAPQFHGADSFCHDRALVDDGAEQWEIDRTGAIKSERSPYVPTDPCGEF